VEAPTRVELIKRIIRDIKINAPLKAIEPFGEIELIEE
jgi:hypothetical protein